MITKEVSHEQEEYMSRRNRRREKPALEQDTSFNLMDKGSVVCQYAMYELHSCLCLCLLGRFHPFIKVPNPFSAKRSLFLPLILLGTCSVEIFGPSLPSDVGV